MRVEQVDPGDLIKPAESHCFDILSLGDRRVGEPEEGYCAGFDELHAEGVSHEAMIMTNSSWVQGFRSKSVAVYIKKFKTSELYRGLKTHHVIMIDGIMCTLDGYQFAYINKV